MSIEYLALLLKQIVGWVNLNVTIFRPRAMENYDFYCFSKGAYFVIRCILFYKNTI